ncbi:MAG: hypothetical protein KC656_33740, partial [Myxococcales bacterium]|nr:hypothetical protein [Myxococcales bacterium]
RVVFGGVMLAQVGPEGGRVRFPERRVEPWFLGPGGSSLAPRRGISWQPDAAVPGLLEGQGEGVVPIHPASHRRVRVVDADGVPVVGAWVHTLHGTDGWTDEEGTVDVWSRREEGLFGFEMLEVEAFGFAPWSSSADLLLLDPLWDLLAGEGPRTEEVRLDRARTVEVVCVGAREPGCAELSKLACAATPGRPGRADACRTWGDVRVCACPEEGWVLGGGLFAEVTPAPTVALDLLAASGGLRGGACEEDGVLLVSEDWSMARHERRKLLSLIENPGLRDSVCEDGRSVVRGLPPGRWVVYGHDVGPRREEVSFSSPADVLAWMAAMDDEDRPVVEVGQDVVDLDAVLR